MESHKLGKKIRDWAINLGFRLPDGSTPSANYFTPLTATPHRRQLWEAVIELVQSRQKIEYARKQILVAKLLDGKKFGKINSRKVTDRIELWHKQNEVENEIKENRKAVLKLENNIMEKTSDLLSEIHRLAELENQFDGLEEKSLVLKLFSRKEKEIIEVLERSFFKENKVSNLKDNLEKFEKKLQENLDCIGNEVINDRECKCSLDGGHNCELLHEFEELCNFGLSEGFLWERVMKLKENALEKFSSLLEKLNSSGKNILGDKKSEIEKNTNLLITQLKQKITEKSLQVIINSTEGKLLDLEIENLEGRLDQRRIQNRTLNDTASSVNIDGMSNESYEKNEKMLKAFKSYLNMIGLKSYLEFLKKESKRLEEERMMMMIDRKPEEKGLKNGEEETQLAEKVFESIVEYVNKLKLEEREVKREIFHCHDKFEILVRVLKEDIERRSGTNAVDGVVKKLKLLSEKRIEVLSETPFEAFRSTGTSSECTSASYGGELKQFYSAMLISPFGQSQNILSKIEKRKRIVNEVRKFISEREKLTFVQRQIQDGLNSLNYDSRLCEKNFKESDGTLWNVSVKTEELLSQTDLIEKILINWVQQPYISMIKETSEGKKLKKYEEQYVGEKKEEIFGKFQQN